MFINLVYFLVILHKTSLLLASSHKEKIDYESQENIEKFKSSYLQKVFDKLETFSAEDLLALEEAISCENLKKHSHFGFLKEAIDILDDEDFIKLLERIKDILDYQQKNISSQMLFPDHWEPQCNNIQLFKLNPKSTEFKFVEERIRKDGNKHPIKSIIRLQNKSLYRRYFLKKQRMSKSLADHEDINEACLYHFGKSQFIPYIGQNGIRCEFAKELGAFGKGAYFCCSALSERLPPEANVIIFTQVLLGKSIPAKAGHKNLPFIDREKGILADSTKAPNAPIWVIYNNEQIYPAYFIELENETI